MTFVREVVDKKFRRGRERLLVEERAALRPLPAFRLSEYTRVLVRVRKWNTIQVASRTYSVRDGAHRSPRPGCAKRGTW